MSERDYYPGLDWIDDPLEQPQVVAASGVTPIRYVIDTRAPGAFALLMVFSDSEMIDLTERFEPHVRVGVYGTLDEAKQIAERHDFRFFRTSSEWHGRSAVFGARGGRLPMGTDAEDPAGEAAGRRGFSDGASYFQARKSGNKQNTDGSWKMEITIGQGETPVWLQDAPMGEILQLGAISLGHSDDPEGEEHRRRIADVQRRSQMRPQEPEFQEWMMRRYDRWGLIGSATQRNSDEVVDAVAETLRRLIGVPSRSELKTNMDAVERFERLDREYYFDMARARGVYLPRRPAA